MTATTLTLADFLLARVAEDEAAAQRRKALLDSLPDYERAAAETVRASLLGGPSWQVPLGAPDPARVLAECESKRAIVALHEKWPVLVETEPTLDATDGGNDLNQVTFRMSKQFAWVTEREYRARFGTEPPAAPILRALAKPYADHPDFDPAWL